MAIYKTVAFKDAKNQVEEERKPMPNGVYKLRVAEAIEGNTKEGRPNARFVIEVLDNPDFAKKKINHYLTIATLENSSGINFMVDFAAGFNSPWGDKGFDPQSFVGKTCRANVVVNGEYNKIKSFVN